MERMNLPDNILANIEHMERELLKSISKMHYNHLSMVDKFIILRKRRRFLSVLRMMLKKNSKGEKRNR